MSPTPFSEKAGVNKGGASIAMKVTHPADLIRSAIKFQHDIQMVTMLWHI